MAYQGRQPGVGVRNRFIYSATNGQTSFSGADSNGLTLAYADATYVDVFLNGTLLVPVTDYAATTKTSVVLGSGAAASDIVEIVAYDISSIANAVPTSGGTFTGAVTVQGNFSADGGTIKLDGNYPVGTGNVALGDNALVDSSLSGGYNTAIGQEALNSNTSGSVNTAIGNGALYLNTTGASNISVGSNSLADNTTGGSNVAVGRDALGNNTTASNNTAVGYQAGYTNTTGVNNLSLGFQAGYTNATSNYNTAVGTQSLANNTGSNNVALGQSALFSNTTASDNIAVGRSAMYYNTTGSENVALGRSALALNTTASHGTAVGREALNVNTTGAENSAFGSGALVNNTTGSNNVGLGRYALALNTTASNNTAVGYKAGYLSTAQHNTFIGYGSGETVTTGSKNTILGRYDGNYGGLDIRTSSNNIVLSDGDGNPRVHVDSSGTMTLTRGSFLDGGSASFAIKTRENNANMLFQVIDNNTTITPLTILGANGAKDFGAHESESGGYNIFAGAGSAASFAARFEGTGTVASNLVQFTNGYGQIGSISIASNGTTTNYVTSSDYRLKTDVQPVADASARIQSLNPVNFEWIRSGTRTDGFLAHEAQSVIPECATGTKDAMRDEEYEVTSAVLDEDGNVTTEAVMGTRSVPDYQGIDQSKLVPLLTAALQEALAKIDAMETRITTLEG